MTEVGVAKMSHDFPYQDYIMKTALERLYEIWISNAILLQLHMLGDGGVRGATLETCLAKIQYCSGIYVCVCVCVWRGGGFCVGVGGWFCVGVGVYIHNVMCIHCTPDHIYWCMVYSLRLTAECQVVGMSATLSNINDLATFLRAEIYSSDFRPVSYD